MTSPSPNLLRGFRLVSAATHLDAWHAIHDGPPNGLWSVKPWRSGSCIPESWPQLVELEELRPYQTLVLREEDDKPVACAHCVPFYWPELPSSDYSLEGSLDWALSLPDRGWDEIMPKRPFRPGVTVSIEYRGTGIADALLLNFKALARQHNLRALVAPLRPTAKYRFPDVSFTEYYTWAQGEPRRGAFSWDVVKGTTHRPLPFDPWLRKHIRMGATIIKLAPKSFTVEGSALEWQRWLGDKITLDSVVDEHGDDFSTPVRWDPETKLARCVDSDLWVMHPL